MHSVVQIACNCSFDISGNLQQVHSRAIDREFLFWNWEQKKAVALGESESVESVFYFTLWKEISGI